MKIKNMKTAELYKRCLAAKQLESYAELCEIMQEFDELKKYEQRRSSTMKAAFEISHDKSPKFPNPVNTLLDKYLPIAAKGDMSFFKTKEFKDSLQTLSPSIQSNIESHLQNYCIASIKFNEYKTADAEFNKCIIKKSNGTPSFSKENFEKFKNKMYNMRAFSFAKFNSDFEKHSAVNIAHDHYIIYQSALKKIEEFQPNMTLSKSFKNVTPATFGANIQGIKRTTGEKLYEDSKKYSAKASQHRKIRKILAAGLATIILTSGAGAFFNSQYQDAVDYKETTIDTANKLLISKETKQNIETARELLENLKNNQNPSKEDFYELLNLMDDNLDDLCSDLLKVAIKDELPDISKKITNIETIYNDRNASTNSDDLLQVTYEGDYGIEKSLIFSVNPEFNLFLSSDETNPITLERKVDNLKSSLYGAYDSSSSLKQRGEKQDKLIKEIENIQKKIELMAAKQISIDKNFQGDYSAKLEENDYDER